MAEPPSTTTLVVREMGVSHADFFRVLPFALAGKSFRVNDAVVVVEESGSRQVTISLAPQTERRIARLRLPVTHVTFAFHGYTESERAVFMRQFERCYQRGGG